MRRAFQFRLARVRRVREAEERTARAAWKEAESAARVADGERERRSKSLAASRSELVEILRAGAVDPNWFRHAQDALDRAALALRSAHERALTLRQQAERLATAWRERERDRRALLKLEERLRARHALERTHQDALEADERALARKFAADRFGGAGTSSRST